VKVRMEEESGNTGQVGHLQVGLQAQARYTDRGIPADPVSDAV